MCFTDVNVHKVLLDDDNLLRLLHLTVDHQSTKDMGTIDMCFIHFTIKTLLWSDKDWQDRE